MTIAEAMKAPAPVCLDDVRSAARAVLEPAVWDFVEGGSGTEAVLVANRAAGAGGGRNSGTGTEAHRRAQRAVTAGLPCPGDPGGQGGLVDPQLPRHLR
jgi:hypothetical protein